MLIFQEKFGLSLRISIFNTLLNQTNTYFSYGCVILILSGSEVEMELKNRAILNWLLVIVAFSFSLMSINSERISTINNTIDVFLFPLLTRTVEHRSRDFALKKEKNRLRQCQSSRIQLKCPFTNSNLSNWSQIQTCLTIQSSWRRLGCSYWQLGKMRENTHQRELFWQG